MRNHTIYGPWVSFILLLLFVLLVISACAVSDHARVPVCTPGPPAGVCEKQPGDDQRPAWFYISPPGT